MFKTHRFDLLQLGASALTLAAGALLYWQGSPGRAGWLWLIGAASVLLTLLVRSARALWRRNLGVDVIALAAIGGALMLEQTLTAAVIALMSASGRALESYAEQRARDDMSALLGKAPRLANRYQDGSVVQVALAAVAPGERLLVRPGETVPVDGTLLGEASIDASSLTGESLPVAYRAGAALGSGVVNAGAAFDLLATSTAENSTFTGIIRLVEAARQSKAPAARLADRYALLFVPLSFGLAGLAWLASGEPGRALAVLVVATPCPLILAVPVAIVSAMSRCARHGVLIKHGGALEQMARVHTIFFDKTGTLTGGQARLAAMACAPSVPPADALRLAASLEQLSSHAIAQAVVTAALERGLALALPEQVSETPGAGLAGLVDGRRLRVGSYDYVAPAQAPPAWCAPLLARIGYEGAAAVCIGIDGALCAVLQMADQIRLDTPRALRLLRAAGVQQLAMLTGDRRAVAASIASALGIDRVLPEQTPATKLAAIAQARRAGVTMMVGDGINDAPALAAADVGVAMGARGAAAAAESAQVVLLVDRLDRLAFAVRLAQRTRAIALQSVIGGMALSFIAMLVAAFGYLPALAGAVLQELIDVAVIANALRVLRVPRVPSIGRPGAGLDPAELATLREEHARLLPVLEQVRSLAERADSLAPAALCGALARLDTALREQILPHEARDDAALYPRLARLVGGDDPLAAMSMTHREIFRLSRVIERLAASAADAMADSEGAASARLELRGALYGLEAVLRLHFSQEEEIYDGLAS